MEDFVTFEIAKKLKEKGFNCKYPFAMYTKYEQFCPLYSSDKHYFGIDDFDKHACIAPTISQVLKWLREKEISVEPLSTPYNDWKCYIKNKGEIVTMISGDKYKTYEQAALAGIEYVLDNLIK